MPSSCSEIQSLSVTLQYLCKTRTLSLHSNAIIEGGWLQRKAYGPIYNTAKKHTNKITADRHPQKFTVYSGLCWYRHFICKAFINSAATTSIHHGAFIWWPWAQGDTVPWEVKSKDVCRCCVWRPVCVIEGEKGKKKAIIFYFLQIENWFWQLIEGYAYLEAALSPVFFPLHSSSAYNINSSYLSIKWSPGRDKVAVLLPSHPREKKFSRAEEVKFAFK